MNVRSEESHAQNRREAFSSRQYSADDHSATADYAILMAGVNKPDYNGSCCSLLKAGLNEPGNPSKGYGDAAGNNSMCFDYMRRSYFSY